jgi:hypothetical protein
MYYIGRGKDGHMQTSAKPHNAALMTEALAELLVTKLNNIGHHAEVCELLADETSTIHDSLVDMGEDPAASRAANIARGVSEGNRTLSARRSEPTRSSQSL